VRRLLFWAVVIGAVLFLAAHIAEIAVFARSLMGAEKGWLLAAVGLQAVYFVLYAECYRSAFMVVDTPRPMRQMLPAVFAALFANVVTPTAGAAGPALIIDDAVQYGANPARAVAATLLAQGCVFLGHAIAVAPGLLVLALSGLIRPYQIVGMLVLMAIVFVHIAAFVLALRSPRTLLAILLGLADAAERASRALRHPIHVPEDWAERTTSDSCASAALVARRPSGIVRTLVFVVAGFAFDLASLYAIAMAFDFRLGSGEVLAGYAVGRLFWIVSPLPQGIGLVGGAMILTLTSFHASPDLAIAIATTYRGIAFWLPFFIGMLMLRVTGSFALRRPAKT